VVEIVLKKLKTGSGGSKSKGNCRPSSNHYWRKDLQKVVSVHLADMTRGQPSLSCQDSEPRQKIQHDGVLDCTICITTGGDSEKLSVVR